MRDDEVEPEEDELDLEEYDEVVARFAGSTDPAEVEEAGRALIDRGDALAESGRLDAALTGYDDALARLGEADEPALQALAAEALVSKGLVLAALDEVEAAIAAYDEAVTSYGASTDDAVLHYVAFALDGLGAMLVRAGRFDEAIAASDELVGWFGATEDTDTRRRVAQALTRKAWVLRHGQDRVESSLAVYDELIRRFGDESDADARVDVARALSDKALALGELGRQEEAIVVGDAAVERFGEDDDPDVRAQVAWALLGTGVQLRRLGRLDEADAAYDGVVEHFGDDDDPGVRVVVVRAARARHVDGPGWRWAPDESYVRQGMGLVAEGGRELVQLVGDLVPWRGSREAAEAPAGAAWFGALSRARREVDVMTLVDALADPRVGPRLIALRYLSDLEAVEAAAEVASLLEAEDTLTRVAAARALGSIAWREQKDEVAWAAQRDPSPLVRLCCTYVLGFLAEPSDRELLERRLADRSWGVRGPALVAVGRLENPASLAAIRHWQAQDRRRWYYPLLRPTYERVIRRLVAAAGRR